MLINELSMGAKSLTYKNENEEEKEKKTFQRKKTTLFTYKKDIVIIT